MQIALVAGKGEIVNGLQLKLVEVDFVQESFERVVFKDHIRYL